MSIQIYFHENISQLTQWFILRHVTQPELLERWLLTRFLASHMSYVWCRLTLKLLWHMQGILMHYLVLEHPCLEISVSFISGYNALRIMPGYLSYIS